MLEHALIDIGVGVRWLREEAGVERVVILGNSGGGSLMGAYQAEATPPTLAAGVRGAGRRGAGQPARRPTSTSRSTPTRAARRC